MKKIILLLEVAVCAVAVIFAFFYGATYSERIMESMPFFFSVDEGVSVEQDGMMIRDEEGLSIDDKIDDFFNEGEGMTPSDVELDMESDEELMPTTGIDGVQEDADAIDGAGAGAIEGEVIP